MKNIFSVAEGDGEIYLRSNMLAHSGCTDKFGAQPRGGRAYIICLTRDLFVRLVGRGECSRAAGECTCEIMDALLGVRLS